MIHEAPIYIGKYEIEEVEGIKYLHCFKPELKKYQFEKNRSTKKFLDELVNLRFKDEEVILEYVNKNGILVNTRNQERKATYLGTPISKKSEPLVSPFSHGVCMHLTHFKQEINLIKNIWLLNTLIAQKDNYANKTSSKEGMMKTVDLITEFYCLLYQPYRIPGILDEGVVWTNNGDTPLSRFSVYFHEILMVRGRGEFTKDYIRRYNQDLLELGKLNIEEKFEIHTEDIKRGELVKNEFATLFPYQRILVREVDNPEVELEKEPFEDSKCVIRNYIPISEQFRRDSMEFYEFLSFLKELERVFRIKMTTIGNLEVVYDTEPKNLDELIVEVCKWGRILIAEIVNSYTCKIAYKVIVQPNGEYIMQLESKSLLQNIYLEMGQFLDHYQVTRCQYRKCKKMVISTKYKPAQCCCHNHYTNYVNQLKKDGLWEDVRRKKIKKD